jgi:hypothetical protein
LVAVACAWRGHMEDMQAHLETLRKQIVECERLKRQAKSRIKRAMYLAV